MFELPDYNASREELLTFIDGLMDKCHTSNIGDLIIYYELNAWLAVVSNDGSRGHLFGDKDRERLFKFLRAFQKDPTRVPPDKVWRF